MKPHRLAVLSLALLASAATGCAATLVTYLDNPFTVVATDGYPSVGASSVDANVTASMLVNAVSAGSANTNANFSTTTYNAYAKSNLVSGGGGTPSSTSWLTFNVSANDDYELNLTSLTFKFGGSNANTSGSVSYTPAYTVSYSYDNFETAGIVPATGGTGSASLTIAFGTSNVANTATIDLSSIGGIASSETITFRIALSDNLNTQNVSCRVDDLVLAGTVAASSVPEPSTYAIIAGALALGLVVARRRV